MKKLFFLLTIFYSLQAIAQPYTISFSGTGLLTVQVQNLTTGLVVDVPAGDLLILSTNTDIAEVNERFSPLKIYPNPMTDKSTVEILPPFAGDAIISVIDLAGRVLTQYKGYVENLVQDFSLSGIKNGLHIITIKGNGYQISEKLISNGKSTGTPKIVKIGKNIQTIAEKKFFQDSKGEQGIVNMDYIAGQRLKYTAVSGNNKTVMTDIPTANKTVTFTFIECKDVDNNYYPIVKIGSQIWMAENLKTTKYNDGAPIPNRLSNSSWLYLASAAYCDYDNIPSYSNTYGRLYNWHAVNTGKLCPIGWYVPTEAEWTQLINYLGGSSIAGGKLKEIGTLKWSSPNSGATNETGFTALPGGFREPLGYYSSISLYGSWWSSTGDSSIDWAWFSSMIYNSTDIKIELSEKQSGSSVICFRALETPIITWANPADITLGTALSATQLNSSANVPGTYVYTPGIGTILGLGNNQNLKVDFTPADAEHYILTTKTVTINVVPVLKIGDIYKGGIIGYILQEGDPGYVAGETHGLIAAPSDQSTGIQWYNGSFVTTGATSIEIGKGQANTTTIVNIQGAGNYAAQLCNDLVLGGYSDWYLPSKDELNKLYLNKTAVGGFASANYYSSTETGKDYARCQNFFDGSFSQYSKNGLNRVRAIRTF